jgi:hypothetical protein
MKINSFDSLIGLRQPLFISDKGIFDITSDTIEPWAKACMYLGKWAKSRYRKDTRRITFVVLPSREIATAFISLGALISSVRSYKDELSWTKFSTLDSGLEIYWKRLETGDLYFGNVIGVELIDSEPGIKLKITRSRKKSDINAEIWIPEDQFTKYKFSLEKPASAKREAVINTSLEFLEHLIGNVSPNWAKSDGQDLLLVTKINRFKSSIDCMVAAVGNEDFHTIKFESLLGFEKLGDTRLSKLKISHPRGCINTSAELVILDGPSSFSIKEHIPPINDLLVVLDLIEFNENEFMFVNELQGLAELEELKEDALNIAAEKFPIGFEVSSYSFPR